MKFTLALAKAIGDELAIQVEDQGPYAAPEVIAVRVAADRRSVEVECSGGDEAALRPRVEAYVSDFVSRFRKVAGRVHTRTARRDDGPLLDDAFDELVDRGWAFQLGKGQVGLAGPALHLARVLDSAWRDLAVSFGAVEHRYPTLIPADVLHRCGYFSSFPHLVSVVSHFVEDYEQLKRIRDANAASDRMIIPDRGAVALPDACFTPATCYHCYQHLEGATLAAPGQVFTAVGSCARYESTNMQGLRRLWEFTMREVIFVGAEAWVAERRAAAIDAVVALLGVWDLECAIETANDPFFAPMYATKTFWQSQGNLKYEMRLTVGCGPDGATVTSSAGSFNLHEGFFGETFGISLDSGEPVFTGCTAFGLERWILACFAQHGFDPGRWPEPLRGAVFE